MKKFYINQVKEEFKLRTKNKTVDIKDEKLTEELERQSAFNAFYAMSSDEREVVRERKLFK